MNEDLEAIAQEIIDDVFAADIGTFNQGLFEDRMDFYLNDIYKKTKKKISIDYKADKDGVYVENISIEV